jgi:hypothetical protein
MCAGLVKLFAMPGQQVLASNFVTDFDKKISWLGYGERPYLTNLAAYIVYS